MKLSLCLNLYGSQRLRFGSSFSRHHRCPAGRYHRPADPDVHSGPNLQPKLARNGANFEFIISQAMTLTVSSFTNSSIGGTGIFDFSSIGLYAGVGTAGQLLQSGAITIDGNTRRASLNQFSLNQGAYTIAFRGNVTGAPAGVGSNITFAAGASPIGAVPEPATWAMMMLGFGGRRLCHASHDQGQHAHPFRLRQAPSLCRAKSRR